MKQISTKKLAKKNTSQHNNSDDNVRYKLSKQYYNSISKTNAKTSKKIEDNDDNIRYKFATTTPKSIEKKKKKPKIKVNFWSNKQIVPRSQKDKSSRETSNRRHTISTIGNEVKNQQKIPVVKVRKRVSFLPSPYFTENHVPMVTVPDDLTIQINAEEAKGLGNDLNLGFLDNKADLNQPHGQSKKKARTSMTHTTPKGSKQISNNTESINQGNENELEFFSKYVVQKLRRMETNQRIYSENLINTVLMLGQLGELNGKSKIMHA